LQLINIIIILLCFGFFINPSSGCDSKRFFYTTVVSKYKISVTWLLQHIRTYNIKCELIHKITYVIKVKKIKR